MRQSFMPMKKTCLFCGRFFVAKANKRYCRATCAVKNRLREQSRKKDKKGKIYTGKGIRIPLSPMWDDDSDTFLSPRVKHDL